MEDNNGKRSKIVGVRLSEIEYKELEQLAKKADRKISEYIRRATLKYIDIKKDSEEI